MKKILLLLLFVGTIHAQTKHALPRTGGGTGPWNSADSLRILTSNGSLAPTWQAGGMCVAKTYDTIWPVNTLLTGIVKASVGGTLCTTFTTQPRGASVLPQSTNAAGFVDTPRYYIIGYEGGIRDSAWLWDLFNGNMGESTSDTGFGSSVTHDAGTYDSIVSIKVYGNAADSVEFVTGDYVWLGQTLTADPACFLMQAVGEYGIFPTWQSIYAFSSALGRGLHYSLSIWNRAHGGFPIKFYYTTQ